MNLLLDACLSPDWQPVLEQAGFPCRHWFSIGALNAPDSEIMKWAATHDFVVLTADLDYGQLLFQIKTRSPSVVTLRCDDLRPTALANHLIALLRQHEKDLQEGALMVVDRVRARVRILPLST
jgi:predicted nuclease of predicted toxin-antitoxin system